MTSLALERIEGIGPTIAVPIARVSPTPTPPITAQSARELQFVAMDLAFRTAGGLATGNQVAALIALRHDQAISRLAHHIVKHEVVSFQWRSEILLPLFQFDLADMSIRPPVSQVVQELYGPYDEWEIARWFSERNCLLSDLPLNVITRKPESVLQAARADRFIARW